MRQAWIPTVSADTENTNYVNNRRECSAGFLHSLYKACYTEIQLKTLIRKN